MASSLAETFVDLFLKSMNLARIQPRVISRASLRFCSPEDLQMPTKA